MKPKKCKYQGCGVTFIPLRPLQQCCSPFCAYKYQGVLKQKKEAKDWAKQKSEIKTSLLTLTELEKQAKVFFQKWVRIRDYKSGYTNCISCNDPITIPTSDGSHFYDANKFSGGIFHEMNCHASCQKCNRFLHGNLLDYRDGLIKRYSAEYVINLESMKDDFRNKKYTREELVSIKNKYAKLIRDFK